MPLSLQELSELVSAGVITPETANAIRRYQNGQKPALSLEPPAQRGARELPFERKRPDTTRVEPPARPNRDHEFMPKPPPAAPPVAGRRDHEFMPKALAAEAAGAAAGPADPPTPDRALGVPQRGESPTSTVRVEPSAALSVGKPATSHSRIAEPPPTPPLENVPPARFDFTHTAYYGGALLVMGALGWYMTKALASGDGVNIAGLALFYGLGFLYAGEWLWQKPALRQPAGLLYVLAVWMVPLLLFGIMRASGAWPDINGYDEYFTRIKGQFVLLEIATTAAAGLAIRHRPFPFLTFPIAFATWFLAMDLTALVAGDSLTTGSRQLITALIALLMMLVAYYLESRAQKPYAFWFYLFGLLGLWGVVGMEGPSSPMWPVLAVACMAASISLGRRTFMVFGGIAVHVWLGYLSFVVFRDSALFPLALSGVGVLMIWSGIWYARNGERLAELLRVR